MAKKNHDRLKISGLVELSSEALRDTNGGRGRGREVRAAGAASLPGHLGTPEGGSVVGSFLTQLPKLWR